MVDVPGCRKCHHLSYVNQHKLDTTNKLKIVYQSPSIVTALAYPRCYTISTEEYESFVISVGSHFSEVSSRYMIRGEWIIDPPSIHLYFTLDDEAGAVSFSNIVLCSRISLVLEAVAFAEIPLLSNEEELGSTRIIISFISRQDKTFQRDELWNTLGDWLPVTLDNKNSLLLIYLPQPQWDDLSFPTGDIIFVTTFALTGSKAGAHRHTMDAQAGIGEKRWIKVEWLLLNTLAHDKLSTAGTQN